MNIPHPCAGESRLGGGGGGTKIAPQTALSSTSGACSYSYQQILFRAIKASIKGAILGYGIRGGLDLLLKLISVSRGKISLSEALRKSLLGEDAFRFTSFFGVYGLLWKLTNGLLVKWRGTDRKNDKWNGFISGAVAGTALICESPHRRVSIAQQMLIRGLQCVFNSLESKRIFSIPHGNALIFILSSAQVMYGYAMQPKSLDNDFYKFMIKSAGIPEKVLAEHRKAMRGDALVDVANLMQVAKDRKASTSTLATLSSLITPNTHCLPCLAFHPSQESCSTNSATLFRKVLFQILPVYLSLNFVPMVTLSINRFIKDPKLMIQKALVNAGQSSVFFATFVSSYQALVCLHRARKFDHKLVYYILGLISSSSIFIEHQKRRTELALYVLPRGVDCLYRILLNRRLMIGIPYFDVAMFSTGMGLLTMYLQAEHEQMSGMVYGFMSRIDGLIDPKPR